MGAPRLKPYPLNLWRVVDGSWTDLGSPGAFSSSEMAALTGGLVFVPYSFDEARGATVASPLRVSRDRGETWEDWEIPQKERRCRSDFSGIGVGPCTVMAGGDYVVIASNYGWVRRSIRGGGWKDITPPRRARINDDDPGGYGVLALNDGTLIATANHDWGEPDSTYRVSRDGGATWGAAQRAPGDTSTVDRAVGSTVYATCWKRVGAGLAECGAYASTDLEHWTHVAQGVAPDVSHSSMIDACRRSPTSPYRETASSAGIGPTVYAITAVHYVHGREATRKTLRSLDFAHRVGHVLERSTDDCKTWEQVPTGS
jgi:hypothetical protein